jgi:hypothetical protein
MNFPIVLKTPGHTEPDAGLYYLVADNGIFQVRDTPMYRAVTRTPGPVPGLRPEYERVQLKFPRLRRRQMEDVLAFFKEVYDRDRAEAIVVLFYRLATREFHLVAPPQTLLGHRRYDGRWRADHGLRYENVPRPQGCVRFGTIHSHADLPAYSSGTDCADEQFEDGLHVVVGDFGYRELSIAAAFVVNGARFRLAPAEVVEPCKLPQRRARPEWMACIKREGDDRGVSDTTVVPTLAAAAGAPLPTGVEDDGEATDRRD